MRFAALLECLHAHDPLADEITLFTSETHPPLPLEIIAARTAVLTERMPLVRAAGFRTGINVLGTIGHHEENLSHSLTGDYTPMCDLQGTTCQGALCPNDAAVRDYIRELYTLIAAARPDYIWVDDDIRLAGHWPIHAGCFCDHCVERFAHEHGVRHTRDSLRIAFDTAPLDERLALRRAWLSHNRTTIARVLALIERTVHAVCPGLPLGFMTGERFFEGYDFARWAAVLAGPDTAPVIWRPGGGFYDDHTPAGLYEKSHDIGRQIANLPPTVISIQSEIENFPYQSLRKSAQITTAEVAAHMAAGCTGAALNILTMQDEPLEEYHPLLRRLQATRPFYDLLARTFGRSPAQGLFQAWNLDSSITAGVDDGWLPGTSVNQHAAQELFELGLPAAYRHADAQVTLLAGDSPLAFSDEALLQILSGGVYLDGTALRRLRQRGCAEYLGFDEESQVMQDCLEQFTDHPLNGHYAGYRRDARQSCFWPGPASILTARDPHAEPLARPIDYADHPWGACCLGVYENRLGGRMCVAGYAPWTLVQSLAKSVQMKALMRWLSRDTLAVSVESYHKIQLWARQCTPGVPAVAVMNISHDTADGVIIRLRTRATSLCMTTMACQETLVPCQARDGVFGLFCLPELPAWSMVLLTTEQER
jgi:hypothetical protein